MKVKGWTSIAFVLALAAGGCSKAPSEPPLAPLLDRAGDLHYPVSTSVGEAQRYFDQGLTLVYAFNHDEAERSFREAARRDAKLAMAWWGVALALAPNINDPLPDPDREKKAWEAISRARELAEGASEKERALIEALAARHSGADEIDRPALNRAYADAMAVLAAHYPDDVDILVLRADAVMNTMPWDYWLDGGRTPKPETEPALAAIERALELNPRHPGANHLYIHAVEASTDPDRAVPAAERLGGLVPIAGHLVHMPAHIWIRVGRYDDAVEANRLAIDADEDYISQCRAQGVYPVGYYPHNVHFLWAALILQGRGAESIEAARKAATRHTHDHFEAIPKFDFGHLLRGLPALTLVRFGRWDAVLAEPEPEPEMLFARATRHFARGMAHRAQGRLDEAETELAALAAIAADPVLAETKFMLNNGLDKIARVAELMLRAEIRATRKDYRAAEPLLREAAALEDSFIYSEPPDWPLPPRHSLGAVLLEAGRPAEAEKVFREDLDRHRDNGWSLFGLRQALEAQGKSGEAAEAAERFRRAWAKADVELAAARF